MARFIVRKDFILARMDVHEALLKFSQKQIGVDEAMRALVSYDGWFAPAGWAATAFATNVFDKVCVWGERSNLNPGQFWIFTSDDRGLRSMAKGAQPGPYAGPIRGCDLFSKLPDGIATLLVNPGSPPHEGWYMGAEAIPLGRAWGRAIALEQIIAGGKESFALAIGKYEGFGVMITAAGAIVTAVGAAGMKNPGLIFTAGDCLDACKKKFMPGADFRQGTVNGTAVVRDLDRFGVDGYIVNIAGLGPTITLTREVCAGIAELLTMDENLKRLEAGA